MKLPSCQAKAHFSFIFSAFFFVFIAGVSVVSETKESETITNDSDAFDPATNHDSNGIDSMTIPDLTNKERGLRLQTYQGFESIQRQGCSCNEEVRAIHEQWEYDNSQMSAMKGALELFATDLMNLKALVNSRFVNDSTRNKQIKNLADFKEVAFSARVSEHLTNLQPQDIIVFDQLITNDGEAYDPLSGVFTCPLSGTYQLFATVLSGFNTKVESGLVVNDIEVARLYSGAQNAHGSSTATVILLLKRGDLVSVRVLYQPNSHVHGVYSTFSGSLLWSH